MDFAGFMCLCVYVFMWLEFPRAYPVPPWKHKHISTYFMCLCGQVYVFLCVYGISVGTQFYLYLFFKMGAPLQKKLQNPRFRDSEAGPVM